MRAFKAIMFKEFMQIKCRKKSLIISSVCNAIFIGFIGAIRLLSFRSNSTDTPGMIKNIIIYVSIMCTYMSLLSLLRFWQEKSNKTIEMLISAPINVIPVVFAKLLVPVLISFIIGLIDTSAMTAFTVILYGKIKANLLCVFAVQIMFAFLIGIPYSIINAYSMWCMNITYSKLIQGISTFAYVGVLMVMFISKNSDVFLLSKVILICAGALSLIAVCMLFKLDKEKIIIRLLE